MDFDLLRTNASIADELLGHLRGDRRCFPSGQRTHATYDTTFFGCYRVEIHHGSTCQIAIEHVGGEGAFDWSMAESDRRHPWPKDRREDGPSHPPSVDDVRYRFEVFEADADEGRQLLTSILDLDWAEATPEDNDGRDGVIMSGTLNVDGGVRSWTTWSPEPATEPAKAAYFTDMLRFAAEHGSGSLRDDLLENVRW